MSENTLVLLSELIILIGHLKIYFCKIIQQCASLEPILQKHLISPVQL